MKLYVASSWRNPYQPSIVADLRTIGHEVYDFRHPPGGDHLGFSWSDVDPEWSSWTPDEYVEALDDPIAVAGFESDFGAMQWADACVLILKSGRSAHLEAGWFVSCPNSSASSRIQSGLPAPTGHHVTELMYRMATGIFTRIEQLQIALYEGSPMQAAMAVASE